jgi:hypothetical protein
MQGMLEAVTERISYALSVVVSCVRRVIAEGLWRERSPSSAPSPSSALKNTWQLAGKVVGDRPKAGHDTRGGRS